MEAWILMTCPGDVLDCSCSIVGSAGSLQDAVKRMKPIESTKQKARTGFLLVDRSISHLIDVCVFTTVKSNIDHYIFGGMLL
jgi:hypothetical protein